MTHRQRAVDDKKDSLIPMTSTPQKPKFNI